MTLLPAPDPKDRSLAIFVAIVGSLYVATMVAIPFITNI